MMKKATEIFIWIDKRLNWLSGGNIENTISGRVGYYANQANVSVRWFWWLLQFVIDLTFYPLDGHHHCRDSWLRDKTKGDYFPSKYVLTFFLLSLFAVGACIILIIPFYILFLLGIFNKKNI